ncbi:MAG: protein translocase subunit SecF [Acidimicrobiales bacterium]|nr:protein translocase subunit SecF [Acidimicrobiales bacterium]
MNPILRLYRGQTDIDFAKWWKRGVVISTVCVVLSVGSMLTRGLNLGIEFRGGVSWEVKAPGVTVSEVRDTLSALGMEQAKIQIVGTDTVRVQASAESQDLVNQVRDVLAGMVGADPAEVSVSNVGPSWGGEITASAVRALIVFLLAVMAWLTVRLEWKMAIGAIVAMLHDILISVGVYSLFQLEVTPPTVIAFLTILGFSIYDTVVVFDQVQENQARVGLAGRMTYTEMTSLSMNEVLLRSINTSATALLPVLSLLVVGSMILGAVTLEEFAVALLVGLLSGVYSSIFVATPVVVWMKEREPRNRQLRVRLETSRAAGDVPPSSTERTPSTQTGAAGRAPQVVGATARGSGSARPSYSGTIPPRPRKKGKKR